jgi:hypothetical protein
MTHQYVLVTLRCNWADEFDVYGFLVVSTDYFEDVKRRFLALDDDAYLELSFGTNQELTWSNGQEWLDSLNVTTLSPVEAAVYAKHFDIRAQSYDFHDDSELTPLQERAFADGHILAGHGVCGFLDGLRIR